MRIGISASFRLHGASLQHLIGLLQSWDNLGIVGEHRVILYTTPSNMSSVSQYVPKYHVRLSSIADVSTFVRIVWEQSMLSSLMQEDHLDVVFCPGGIVPLSTSVPSVALFQNAGPFCPTVTPRTVGRYNFVWFKSLGLLMRLSAKSAQRVVFISHHLRDTFVRRFSYPISQADVIPYGLDDLSSRVESQCNPASLSIVSPYLLCISHIYRYKRLENLILGFEIALKRIDWPDLKLVIVGKPQDRTYYADLRRLVARHNLEGHVQLAGGVPYQTIGPLLKGCEFFVMQSTCESLAKVLLEAAQAGAAIVCADIPAARELASDIALYFDPYNPDDMASAISRLATDTVLRDELRRRSLLRVQEFPTWDEVGQMTLRSLERAVNGG